MFVPLGSISSQSDQQGGMASQTRDVTIWACLHIACPSCYWVARIGGARSIFGLQASFMDSSSIRHSFFHDRATTISRFCKCSTCTSRCSNPHKASSGKRRFVVLGVSPQPKSSHSARSVFLNKTDSLCCCRTGWLVLVRPRQQTTWTVL